MGDGKHLALLFTSTKCLPHMPWIYSTGRCCLGEIFMCSSVVVVVIWAVQGTRRTQVLQIPQIPMARGTQSSWVLQHILLPPKRRGPLHLRTVYRSMSWWTTWCGSSTRSSLSSWMAASPSPHRGSPLQLEIQAEEAQGNTMTAPIAIIHSKWTAAAETSVTQMKQVLAVISNTTATAITTRTTRAAAVTMTAGAATVAPKIDGDGTDKTLRISVRTSVLHKFVDTTKEDHQLCWQIHMYTQVVCTRSCQFEYVSLCLRAFFIYFLGIFKFVHFLTNVADIFRGIIVIRARTKKKTDNWWLILEDKGKKVYLKKDFDYWPVFMLCK